MTMCWRTRYWGTACCWVSCLSINYMGIEAEIQHQKSKGTFSLPTSHVFCPKLLCHCLGDKAASTADTAAEGYRADQIWWVFAYSGASPFSMLSYLWTIRQHPSRDKDSDIVWLAATHLRSRGSQNTEASGSVCACYALFTSMHCSLCLTHRVQGKGSRQDDREAVQVSP